MDKIRVEPVYRCLLCNELFAFGNSVEIPHEQLPNLIGKVVQNQRFAGNPYLHEAPIQMIHQCANGGGGLGWFAGFRKIGGEK